MNFKNWGSWGGSKTPLFQKVAFLGLKTDISATKIIQVVVSSPLDPKWTWSQDLPPIWAIENKFWGSGGPKTPPKLTPK
jgi:hypothetical protein